MGIVLVLGVGMFFLWRGSFSKEILKLEILGPSAAKAGEEVTYTVVYKNNGNFTLQSPKLLFQLPENSLTEDGKALLSKNLGDIYPGSQQNATFTVRLLGKEGELKVARAELSYGLENLSARYESDTTFTTQLESVPMTLAFDMPSRAEKGKALGFNINYFSNIDYPLENLSIKLDPIQGFTIASATPASLDNVEWKLPTIGKGNGGRISIQGTVAGDVGDVIHVVARLGMWVDGVFVAIKDATQDVQTIQPMLSISQQINGSGNYVASPGEILHYTIFLRNVGTTAFENVFTTITFTGDAFDLSTLSSPVGQVQQTSGLVLFDPNQVFQLQHLAPNQEASVDILVKLKDVFARPSQGNAVINTMVNAFGVTQQFSTNVSARMNLSQKVFYATQMGLDNFGPVPPKVGQETTYAIVWQVSSDINPVSNAKVKAVLPSWVSLNDAITPESEASHFSFDNQSREIVWLAGNLVPGGSKSLVFQVTVIPQAFQTGTHAQVISSATGSGDDQVTGAKVRGSAVSVTTALPDDKANGGVVGR